MFICFEINHLNIPQILLTQDCAKRQPFCFLEISRVVQMINEAYHKNGFFPFEHFS
jgi:hypothetical protein